MIKKVKNSVLWTYVFNDLNSKEIVRTFYEKKFKNTNEKGFSIEKGINKKGDKKWKGQDNSFNSWIDMKDT